MRMQIALNVTDLDAAVTFYSKLFGADVNKRKPGYANFSIAEPPLKLVLFEQPDLVNQLNHLGVEVSDDEEIDAAANQMADAGLAPDREQAEVCCFAKQNKAVAYDPDGTMWEWYRIIEDSDSFFEEKSDPPSISEQANPLTSKPECCG